MTALGTARALRPFRRRAVLVAFFRAGTVAVMVALLVAELLLLRPDLIGAQVGLALPALLAVGLLASGIYARVTMPALRDVARHLDRAARLQDLIVTAEERDTSGEEISAVVAHAALAALRRVKAAQLYPLEAPRQWRRWAALAAVVQVVAIGFAWRGPAERPMPASGAALSLPGSGGGQDAASGAAPPPAAGATTGASTAARATPNLAPSIGRDVIATGATAADAATSGAGAAGGTAPPTNVAASGRETSDGRNRYRQAATRASDAIARGRVPAALRGVVERYFTAIRPQGQ